MREEKTEILVIGSEAAGAKAAIEAQEAGADVIVVTKGLKGRSGSTVLAGTGIQTPIGHEDPRDNPDVFFEDVIKTGAFLNNQKLVERLVNLAVTEVPKTGGVGRQIQKDRQQVRAVSDAGRIVSPELVPSQACRTSVSKGIFHTVQAPQYEDHGRRVRHSVTGL